MTAKAGFPTSGTRWGSGCSFLDYDRDGKLDLFVSNYLAFDLQKALEPGQGVNCLWKGIPVNCGPKGLPTDTNLLYHNEGNGTFKDVSVPSGIAKVVNRYPMSAAGADLDGDGWTDLYVACDSTSAILYRNNRDGTFTDVALASGAGYSEYGNPQAGMGLALGDYDGDGRLDILKTHFADDIPALYRSLGGGQYEDLAAAAGLGVRNRSVEWGAGMPDLDNDGRPDVLYVTGNVYPEIERRLKEYPHRGPRVVFRNLDGVRFEDVTERSGPGPVTPHSSRGAAFGDFDNDGDQDVLVMNMNEPPTLLRNDAPTTNGWIEVRLEGTRSNRAAIGATVIADRGRAQADAGASSARRATTRTTTSACTSAWGRRPARRRSKCTGPAGKRRCCTTSRGARSCASGKAQVRSGPRSSRPWVGRPRNPRRSWTSRAGRPGPSRTPPPRPPCSSSSAPTARSPTAMRRRSSACNSDSHRRGSPSGSSTRGERIPSMRSVITSASTSRRPQPCAIPSGSS